MVTTIWALDDFTEANGATRVVPGSHQEPGARPDPAETVPVEMAAGSVLIFSGRLWHGERFRSACRNCSDSTSRHPIWGS
jgi:ectoine hydroxylase-related dioxygenase (phytanoyl-CoA dioxygenase family)